MKTRLTLLFLNLICTSLAFATEQRATSESRAITAAATAAQSLAPGLYLIVSQDDNTNTPFAQVIAELPLAPSHRKIEKSIEGKDSWVRFTGQAVEYRSGSELVLSGNLDAKIAFGGARHIKKGQVGEMIMTEGPFKNVVLKAGVPELFTLNRTEDPSTKTTESAALLLVWKK